MRVIAANRTIEAEVVVINNSKGNEIMIGETSGGQFMLTQAYNNEELVVGYIPPTAITINNKSEKGIVLNVRTLLHERSTDQIRIGKIYQHPLEKPLNELKDSFIALYTDDSNPEDFFKKFYSRVAIVDAATFTPIITIYEDNQ